MQTKLDLVESDQQAIQNIQLTQHSLSKSNDRGQEPFVDIPVTEPSEFSAKAAYYQNLLAKELYETKQRAASVQIAAQAYVEEATKVHVIGSLEVGIYAPFILARSALRTIYKRQIGVLMILALLVGIALVWNFSLTLTVLMGGITAFYFVNLLLTLYLSMRVFDYSDEVHIPDEVVNELYDVTWPRYTILCPLYKEAAVVQQFAEAMQKLDYPVDKLQILFLTESDDEGTREAIRAANLPSYFEIVTVPDGQPRTKPRACNYGLLHATGEFVVIYDAEDVPDSLQLKKAVLAFVDKGLDIGCVQAKLNFYNSRQNLLTRWFTVEYSTWFDTTLPGLQWAQFALPLGGTSNHFRLSTLRGIGAWDAYNVTEDCDLGLRLASQGYRTLVLDSTTYEEANPNVRNWIRQRSRWIKGYMQTYLIYMRQPFTYLNPFKLRDFLSMQLIVGGRTAVLLINPIMWVMVVLYFALRSNPAVVDIYQTLFPGLILYFAVLCLIFGNLTYIYTHFIGCIKRGEFGLVKWTLLMPIYWVLASYAAFKALYQLITKPHYWEKTTHGLHLPQAAQLGKAQEGAIIAARQIDTGGEIEQLPAAWLMNAEAEPDGYAIGNPKPILAQHSESSNPAVQVSTLTSTWVMDAEAAPNDYPNGNGKHIEGTWQLESHLPPTPELATVGSHSNGHATWFPTFDNVPNQTLSRETFRIRISRIIKREKWLIGTIAVALLAGIFATYYYFVNHEILLYHDSLSHLGKARFLFDNLKPGLGQLGAVWLPLPHLLMMPFASVDYLWRTGLAGAAVSMPAYVITAVYLFLSIRRLTHNAAASFVGSLVFILNPNVLYLQATPLTEPLAAATVTAVCYYLLSWFQDENPRDLILMGIATFLATLARYDGWGVCLGLVVLVPFISLFKRHTRGRIESNLIIFAVIGCLGIGLWILWSLLLMGDALYWQHSAFSSQAQQQTMFDQTWLYTLHNLPQSFRFMSVVSIRTIGVVISGLSVLGLALYLYKRRFSVEVIVVLAPLLPFAFYVYSMYQGQAILYLPELVPLNAPHNHYFNDRFGMLAVPPAALFIGLLVAYGTSALGKLWKQLQPRWKFIGQLNYQYVAIALGIAIITGQSVSVASDGIISVIDGQIGTSCYKPHKSTEYLAKYYAGGKILVDTFANQGAMALGPEAGIDGVNIIHDGTDKIWNEALRDPIKMADWIIADPYNSMDRVTQAVNVNDPLFDAEWVKVAEDEGGGGQRLYRRVDFPEPTVERPIRPETIINNQLCSWDT